MIRIAVVLPVILGVLHQTQAASSSGGENYNSRPPAWRSRGCCNHLYVHHFGRIPRGGDVVIGDAVEIDNPNERADLKQNDQGDKEDDGGDDDGDDNEYNQKAGSLLQLEGHNHEQGVNEHPEDLEPAVAPLPLFNEKQPIDNEGKQQSAAVFFSPQFSQHRIAKRRRTSDMIQSLVEQSLDTGASFATSYNSDQQEESNELRQLITDRAKEYVSSILYHNDDDDGNGDEQQQHESRRLSTSSISLEHPKKLLHALSPKIPAIHYSPNIMLRIQSAARSDMDSGIAACLLATLARVCELYDRQVRRQQQQQRQQQQVSQETSPSSALSSFHSSALEIVAERRFEQLVECVLCGLDIQRLLREPEPQQQNSNHVSDDNHVQRDDDKSSHVHDKSIGATPTREQPTEDQEASAENLEYINHHKTSTRYTPSLSKIEQGLSLRDACRAAWGIAILGGHHYDSIGGETIMNLFLALSLRVRELLLAKLDHLVVAGGHEYDKRENNPDNNGINDRMDVLAEEIAEDAATAMWAFACVRACTGIRTVKLFETCCLILCQDPSDLHQKRVDTRSRSLADGLGQMNEVDRLAQPDANSDDKHIARRRIAADKEVDHRKDALLDWLSPNELTDMLWALALHVSSESYLASKEDALLSDTATTLREIAFERLLYWLRQDAVTEGSNHEKDQQPGRSASLPVSETTDVIQEDSGGETFLSVNQTDQLLPSNNGLSDVVQQIFEVQKLYELQTLPAYESGDKISTDSQKHRYFSPHDLCSIVWAVTELRDSSRFAVVELVTKIFVEQGPTSTYHLEGGDLTNLVWSIAKYTSENSPTEPKMSAALLVTTWTAQSAYRRMHGWSGRLEHDHDEVLRAFHPPELGRIIWSVATVFIAHRNSVTDEHRRHAERLFHGALLAAGSSLSVFATEDLARISWAFLEICDYSLYLSQPDILSALGRILITVESSILRWERGLCSSTDAETSKKINESILFATFFGKSSTATPLFNQRIAEVRDDEDDGYEDSKSVIHDKSDLPLLRDLSVDPSTLCRMANGYAKLSAARPFIKGGGSLTRVAMRILAAENGRLMKECSACDIVGLLETIGEAVDVKSEFISRHFVRRVVRMLNEETMENSAGVLSKLSPIEICVMIDSLARNGVRFMSNDHDKKAAYKRLRLAAVTGIFPNPVELCSLPVTYMSKLLRGLVSMGISSCNEDFLNILLVEIERKVHEINHESDLCSLIESLGVVGHEVGVSDLMQSSHLSTAVEVGNGDEINKFDYDSSMNTNEDKDSANVNKLRVTCRRLLSKLAAQAILLVPTTKIEKLRIILSVFTWLPIQEDNLFRCVEDEIEERKLIWNYPSHAEIATKVEEEASALAQSFSSSGNVNADKSGGPKRSFLHAMLFKGDVVTSTKAEPNNSVENFLAKISLIRKELENAEQALDCGVKSIREGAYFGMCCCEEIITAYRRIEFDTGKHRSRYDNRQRRDIAKRVLSRLLPSSLQGKKDV